MTTKSFECDPRELEEPIRNVMKGVLGSLGLVAFCYVTQVIDTGFLAVNNFYAIAITADDVIEIERVDKEISFRLLPLNKIAKIIGHEKSKNHTYPKVYMISSDRVDMDFFFENAEIMYEFVQKLRQWIINSKK